MKHSDILHGFGISLAGEQSLESLYAYAPVYRFSYAKKDWVLKRTGVRSEGNAIAILASEAVRAPPRQKRDRKCHLFNNWQFTAFMLILRSS